MRDQPSPELVELLSRLGLATPEVVESARRRARGLARGLPLFDSVWVDALAGQRLLTPFQAAQINAHEGESLGVGPYVLVEPAMHLGYAQCYRALEITTRRPRLVAICAPSAAQADDEPDDQTAALRRLEDLAHRLAHLETVALTPIEAMGVERGQIWVSGPDVVGMTANQWMLRNGRLPPTTTLEIARQMAAALAELERHELVNGDVSAATLLLTAEGHARLVLPGLRGATRPVEGYGCADLPPHAYDYLAPERVADGLSPAVPSDLYACGCLWWHLLAARPPLAGGNSLAKLKAAQRARIGDVRLLVPDTPAPLAAAITHCTRPAISARPDSFAQLAAALGPPTREGRFALAAAMAQRAPAPRRLAMAAGAIRHSRHVPVAMAAAAGCALMLVVAAWPAWGPRVTGPLARLWSAPVEPDRPAESLADARENIAPRFQYGHAKPWPWHPDEVPAEQDASHPAQQASYTTEPAPLEELLLPAGGTRQAADLKLRAGQIVRAPAGASATLVVPPGGLVIPFEQVQFENIDFVAADAGVAADADALVHVQAGGAEFRNCSFQPGAQEGPLAAIVWHPADNAVAARSRQPRRLVMENCLLRGVALGVDGRAAGPLLIEMTNVLFVGSLTGADSAALCRMHRCPAVDEPCLLAFNHCTLRAAATLIELDFRLGHEPPGRIAIEATACVFAPHSSGSLVRLLQPDQQQLVQLIDWTGEGSLLAAGIPFALCVDGTRQVQAVDDQQAAVEGLAVSPLEFAGEPDGPAAASRVVHWAAPLRNDEAPGVRTALLPAPR